MVSKAAGLGLRSLATFLYVLDFLCSAVVLVVFSYFLAKLSIHHDGISKDWEAVEGLSGTAVLYSIFAVVFTCFLGGISFFAIIAVIFDLLFMGAMIACAVLLRHASDGCKGRVVTSPLGTGLKSSKLAGTNAGVACRMNVAAFATSIAAAFFFFLSALVQLAVMRHHQKEKKYGPSPDNNYTSGSGKRSFFARKQKNVIAEPEMQVAPVALAAPARDIRPSHDTNYTETTMVPQGNGYIDNNKYEAPVNKYEPPVPAVEPTIPASGIVSSVTTTRPGYYDPYYKPEGTATGPALNY